MRPKKPRYVEGIQLVDNLYADNKGRPGRYRYRRHDGSLKNFEAHSVEEANRLAEEANLHRGKALPLNRKTPMRDQLVYYIPQYVSYQEKINPGLKAKRSWSNRRYALQQLTTTFPELRNITHEGIRNWWDDLSYHQQKLRMAAFRTFFNWLMGKGLVPKLTFNPFTTADDKPRLLLKQKPPKRRTVLTQPDYQTVYQMAGELGYSALQIAMELSRYTTMREGDICSLKWSQIDNGVLRVVVSKSAAQKGSARATRLAWSLEQHPILKKSIDRARELSIKHRRCPFIISHRPRRRVWNEQKEHLYQVTPDRLSRMFAEARDACEITGTTFHEIRGLASTLYKKSGYTNEEIKNLMAHESVLTTIEYQNSAELPYQEVALKLDC